MIILFYISSEYFMIFQLKYQQIFKTDIKKGGKEIVF